MQEKQLKQSVYMAIRKSEQGFTLLSMLAATVILFTFLPFLAYATKAVTYESHYEEASIQQFYQFLRDELMSATDYAVSRDKLVLRMRDGKRVSFTRYQNQILRQVDGMGHDIYLRDVAGITFTSLPYGVKAEITSLEGKKYEKSIIFYMGLEISQK